MKYFHYILIALLFAGLVYLNNEQRSIREQSLGATILSTASSDTLNTFRTNVNTSLSNLNATDISTTTALTSGYALYATGVNTYGAVATSAPAVSSSFSYSGTLGYFLGGSSGTLKSVKDDSFRYSTTTSWTATTTIPLEVGYGELWNTIRCFTDAGTVNVHIGYGTASTTLFNASTTAGTITFTTNNTMTSGVKLVADVGTPASSPKSLVCTVNSTL